MKLTGVHLLLTYQCNLECDHCFVWSSPWASGGAMTLPQIDTILQQAAQLGTVKWIYFEGGEPFLYYATLLNSVRRASRSGFRVGIVTNGYWATSLEDAAECLKPFAGLIQDLSISSDLFHWNENLSAQAKLATAAAKKLGIPMGIISIAQPEETEAAEAIGQLPKGESAVMYRGRAAAKLASRARHQPWESFAECPHEDLREPGRVHIDPLGYVHICQGIVLGNVFQTDLGAICQTYDPDAHPITGPLLAGGPVELARRYQLPHRRSYADACHLCYAARQALRDRWPEILKPDQMYGMLDPQPG